MRRIDQLFYAGALLLAGCSVKEDPLPMPELPRALSAWQNDAPFGQAAAAFEQRTTRHVEQMLQEQFPAVKWIGSDAVLNANEAAAAAHFGAHFSGKDWVSLSVAVPASSGTIKAWRKGDRIFAVQFVAPYHDGKLKLVEYYAAGFAKVR